MSAERIGSYRLTEHAQVRMGQRAINKTDIELVLRYGEPFSDGYMLTKSAQRACLKSLRERVKRIERLTDAVVVDDCGVIITAYWADKRRVKKLLAAD